MRAVIAQFKGVTAEDLQGKLLGFFQAVAPVAQELVEGEEVEALLNVLEEIQPNLLLVGLRQGSGMTGRIFGGTAHRIALHAKCDLPGIR